MNRKQFLSFFSIKGMFVQARRSIAILLSFVIVLACTSFFSTTSLAASVNVSGSMEYGMAYAVFEQINAQRTAQGLAPLTLDKELQDAAMLRAAECVVLFDHARPDGTMCFTISDKMYGENIAWNMGYADPVGTAVDGWMNSEGHRANILREGFVCTGIGVFYNSANGGYYFAQAFGYDAAAGSPKTSGSSTVTVSVATDTSSTTGVTSGGNATPTPTPRPTATPTPKPTATPILQPTATPTPQPTATPTPAPTATPTPTPTAVPKPTSDAGTGTPTPKPASTKTPEQGSENGSEDSPEGSTNTPAPTPTGNSSENKNPEGTPSATPAPNGSSNTAGNEGTEENSGYTPDGSGSSTQVGEDSGEKDTDTTARDDLSKPGTQSSVDINPSSEEPASAGLAGILQNPRIMIPLILLASALCVGIIGAVIFFRKGNKDSES